MPDNRGFVGVWRQELHTPSALFGSIFHFYIEARRGVSKERKLRSAEKTALKTHLRDDVEDSCHDGDTNEKH